MQTAVWLHHDAVDRTDALGQGTEFVHQLHRHQFVRLGDVATCNTQRRQTTDGRFYVFNLHWKVPVGTFHVVLFNPEVMQDGGA